MSEESEDDKAAISLNRICEWTKPSSWARSQFQRMKPLTANRIKQLFHTNTIMHYSAVGGGQGKRPLLREKRMSNKIWQTGLFFNQFTQCRFFHSSSKIDNCDKWPIFGSWRYVVTLHDCEDILCHSFRFRGEVSSVSGGGMMRQKSYRASGSANFRRQGLLGDSAEVLLDRPLSRPVFLTFGAAHW